MKKLKIYIFAIIILPGLSNCQQSKNEKKFYLIDPEIGLLISREITVPEFETEGYTHSTIHLKMYENDNLVWETNSEEKILNQCITTCKKSGDTLTIRCSIGLTAAFGYNLIIIGDKYEVFLFSKTDMEIYKLNKNDKPSFGIYVPSEKSELVLTQKPKLNVGDKISGKIEFLSEEYFETTNSGNNKLFDEITGYFSVTITE
jgi:hypothetical protein